VGYIGYLAFGAKTKSVILYNLPNEDAASIAAKIFYVITICGSFVLVSQPIFQIVERANWYKAIYSDKEQKEKDNQEGDSEDQSWSTCQWFQYFGFRIVIITIITLIAFIIPNLNILITFIGAVLGTIVNIMLPILFYNKAYTFTEKNVKLIKAGKKDDDDEKQMLMEKEGAGGAPSIKDTDGDPELNNKDPRFAIKVCNIIVLFLGILVGVVGFVYVIV